MSQPFPPPPPGAPGNPGGNSDDHWSMAAHTTSEGNAGDAERDIEPMAHRPDHYDHDTAYARAMYAELQPKKQEQVKLPRWTVMVIFLMVIMLVLLFTGSTFVNLTK